MQDIKDITDRFNRGFQMHTDGHLIWVAGMEMQRKQNPADKKTIYRFFNHEDEVWFVFVHVDDYDITLPFGRQEAPLSQFARVP